MRSSRVIALAWLAALPGAVFAASPFDGFWMITKDGVPDPGSQVEYRIEKNVVTMTTPMGASYRARADGSDAPMENDANTTSVSVRMEGRNTLVQTDRNNGKAWRVTTIEVLPDGKTAKVTWKSLRNSDAGSYIMTKQ